MKPADGRSWMHLVDPVTKHVPWLEFADPFVTLENGSLVLRFDGGQIGNLASLGDHQFRVTWQGPDRYRGIVTFAARGDRPEQLTLQFPAATFTRK